MIAVKTVFYIIKHGSASAFLGDWTHAEEVKCSQIVKERYMRRQFIPSLFTHNGLNSDRSTVKLVN